MSADSSNRIPINEVRLHKVIRSFCHRNSISELYLLKIILITGMLIPIDAFRYPNHNAEIAIFREIDHRRRDQGQKLCHAAIIIMKVNLIGKQKPGKLHALIDTRLQNETRISGEYPKDNSEASLAHIAPVVLIAERR